MYSPRNPAKCCADSSFRWNIEKKMNYVILNRSEMAAGIDAAVRFGGER